MSEAQLKAFLQKVNGDANIQEKLKAAKSPEEVVKIAEETGYEFTVDQLSANVLLSEDELKDVAGGYTCGKNGLPPMTGVATMPSGFVDD
ncbi:nif11-like leader peptide domain protein [Synechococcus sp. BIOS-E4-1]|uniref:Nif11-like leader peptide family natural product precursor n=1 Tax=Synechococcus sp. BIOS-E4-1 TaxID=1400864 RepID=UPI0016465578|nr:Nif11-like leader peptide family natural product precursor [Synechococcus sp. BIOS-E4-1]QNI54259.1 nif11-like leader peptide domain protein [Synechococcus sp. BIOS-E4-1]